MVQSKQTGQFYATAKKTIIASTFDESTCKGLIGTQIEGDIIKKECEPFEFTIKETGEVITRNFRYVYVTDEKTPTKTELPTNRENVNIERNIFETV